MPKALKTPLGWQTEATKRALQALRHERANPADAGRGAVMSFRGHVITLVSATRDPELRKLGDELVQCAEELFVGPRDKPEAHYRQRIFEAQQKLEAALTGSYLPG